MMASLVTVTLRLDILSARLNAKARSIIAILVMLMIVVIVVHEERVELYRGLAQSYIHEF